MTFLCLAQGNFIKKETLVQVFSCEFCKISKNTSSYRTSLVAASVILLSWLWNHVQSQQQKNKVRFVGSLHGRVAGGSGEAAVSGGFWVVSNGFCRLRVVSICKILWCNVFSSSQKLFTAIKKECHFIVAFSVVWSIYFGLTFSYAILTYYLEIILFRV